MMLDALRAYLSRGLLIASLDLTDKPVTVEGIAAMSIFTRLEALEAAVKALQGASAVDTSGFATADSVTALNGKVSDLASTVGGRLDTIEAEIGSETPADPQPQPETQTDQ